MKFIKKGDMGVYGIAALSFFFKWFNFGNFDFNDFVRY